MEAYILESLQILSNNDENIRSNQETLLGMLKHLNERLSALEKQRLPETLAPPPAQSLENRFMLMTEAMVTVSERIEEIEKTSRLVELLLSGGKEVIQPVWLKGGLIPLTSQLKDNVAELGTKLEEQKQNAQETTRFDSRLRGLENLIVQCVTEQQELSKRLPPKHREHVPSEGPLLPVRAVTGLQQNALDRRGRTSWDEFCEYMTTIKVARVEEDVNTAQEGLFGYLKRFAEHKEFENLSIRIQTLEIALRKFLDRLLHAGEGSNLDEELKDILRTLPT